MVVRIGRAAIDAQAAVPNVHAQVFWVRVGLLPAFMTWQPVLGGRSLLQIRSTGEDPYASADRFPQ